MTSRKRFTNSIVRVMTRSEERAGRLRAAGRRPNGETSPSSGGPGQQFLQPDQIDGGAREDEEPVDLWQPAQFHLAHPGYGLQPPERRFDPRSRMLTLRVAVMTRGAL